MLHKKQTLNKKVSFKKSKFENKFQEGNFSPQIILIYPWACQGLLGFHDIPNVQVHISYLQPFYHIKNWCIKYRLYTNYIDIHCDIIHYFIVLIWCIEN